MNLRICVGASGFAARAKNGLARRPCRITDLSVRRLPEHKVALREGQKNPEAKEGDVAQDAHNVSPLLGTPWLRRASEADKHLKGDVRLIFRVRDKCQCHEGIDLVLESLHPHHSDKGG